MPNNPLPQTASKPGHKPGKVGSSSHQNMSVVAHERAGIGLPSANREEAGPRSSKRVRIQDVARLAQVSLSTVSCVLNEKGNVRSDTRQRVLDVIARVGYQPSLFASNLARRQTNILGIIVSNLLNPFFAEIAAALDSKARDAGYETILVSTNYDPQQQLAAVRQMLSSRVVGVAMLTSENDPEAFALLKSNGVSAVYLDNVHQAEHIGTVRVDKRHGMAIAVEHLLELGHRDILLIKNSQVTATPMLSHTERQLGFEDALRRFGPRDVQVNVIDEPGRAEVAGRNAIRMALETYTFTAVCAINDLVALGASRALQAAGIRIPRDVSVVGFDNTFLCEFMHPTLTTVATPREELAVAVVEMLVALINGHSVPERKPMSVTLVIRESTAPPLRDLSRVHEPGRAAVSVEQGIAEGPRSGRKTRSQFT